MKVQSVLGDLSPEKLGKTLTHEHLSMEFEIFFHEAPKHLRPFISDSEQIKLETLGFLRQYPYASRYNIRFCDEETHEKVISDVKLFKQWCNGDGTIVENTTYGIKRNLKFYREVAQKTGVNVIAGTGHYVTSSQNDTEISRSVENIVNLYTTEVVSGVDVSQHGDGSDVIKCGFIGEVGSTYPITEFEKRTIKATGEVQEAIKCPVSFHPDRNPQAPFEIIRLYLEAGGKAVKAVMSHLDRTIRDPDTLVEFAKLGVFCQFDLFGTECSFYQLKKEIDMPSDAQRMDSIVHLVNEGFGKNILVSHDIHTKHRLIEYGGHGYGHILNNVLPKLAIKGLTDSQIKDIIIENPARWLQF